MSPARIRATGPITIQADGEEIEPFDGIRIHEGNAGEPSGVIRNVSRVTLIEGLVDGEITLGPQLEVDPDDELDPFTVDALRGRLRNIERLSAWPFWDAPITEDEEQERREIRERLARHRRARR